MAKSFEALVRGDKRFEVVVPRNFAMVCFRMVPSAFGAGVELDSANKLNWKLLELVNTSGKGYMTHAMVGEIFVIRCAIGVTLTKEKHVIRAWKVVQETANTVLQM
ncbi:hypothetical protein SLE2022_038720 [Rubroshorea leprosula]